MSLENNRKKNVRQIFNTIAPRYDLLNRLFSAGIDQTWRRKLSSRLQCTSEQMKLLDIATGTADQIISLCQTCSFLKSAIGIDSAEKMLILGREKVLKHRLGSVIHLEEGNAEQLTFKAESFDAVSCSFGLRNVQSLEGVLGEALRVLKVKGQLLVLEFSLPQNQFVKSVYLLYFRYLLPFLGRLFSNHPEAYRYLNESVEHFPYGESFKNILRKAGFVNVGAQPLTFGIATLYWADKPSLP
ncbi:MAG: bifunctional demethylmenaquinone methyltransferase/2-methoxy-6-polyprenyl-1,4-benzoquinol methylase UbiE [Candidatus Margulisiibacteriota bacterium]